MRLKDLVRLKLHAAAAADPELRVILARELNFSRWWNAQVRARSGLGAWQQARRAAPIGLEEADPGPPRRLDGAR